MTTYSHPSRVRGLKRASLKQNNQLMFAPITGAWIETVSAAVKAALSVSHPSRVRGLKHLHGVLADKFGFAPITGAWIETSTVPLNPTKV